MSKVKYLHPFPIRELLRGMFARPEARKVSHSPLLVEPNVIFDVPVKAFDLRPIKQPDRIFKTASPAVAENQKTPWMFSKILGIRRAI